MEQHLIPQQISSYEFRLIGDMTLKQFAQIGAGCLISLILYASPLPGYIKWPLILVFGSAGVGLAFVPIEERPLQTWVWAFFKAIYAPTQFIWKKQLKIPAIFEESTFVTPSPATIPNPSGDQRKLNDYLSTLATDKNDLDKKEENLLTMINSLFSSPNRPFAQEPIVRPVITSPVVTPQRPSQTPPEIVKRPEEPKLQTAPVYGEPYTPSLIPTQVQKENRATKTAQFSPQIPMPSIPEIPNILVGMVFDKEGKMVEGAILEIRDNLGNPVRALRTNKLGQFRIATPLSNNDYEIEIEKEGLEFDVLKITINGEIIQPIGIRAK